jgi:hypothetical protein
METAQIWERDGQLYLHRKSWRSSVPRKRKTQNIRFYKNKLIHLDENNLFFYLHNLCIKKKNIFIALNKILNYNEFNLTY